MSFSSLASGYGRVREDDEDSDDDGSDEEIDESLVSFCSGGKGREQCGMRLKEKLATSFLTSVALLFCSGCSILKFRECETQTAILHWRSLAAV